MVKPGCMMRGIKWREVLVQKLDQVGVHRLRL